MEWSGIISVDTCLGLGRGRRRVHMCVYVCLSYPVHKQFQFHQPLVLLIVSHVQFALGGERIEWRDTGKRRGDRIK